MLECWDRCAQENDDTSSNTCGNYKFDSMFDRNLGCNHESMSEKEHIPVHLGHKTFVRYCSGLYTT
jgi:hypothetical protein